MCYNNVWRLGAIVDQSNVARERLEWGTPVVTGHLQIS
jgi:hypothetical protein